MIEVGYRLVGSAWRATRLHFAFFLVGTAACSGFNVGSSEGCAQACATALACGFLPSGLGFGANREEAVMDCERRCGQSPRDEDDIGRLLACLDGSWTPPDTLIAWCVDDDSNVLAGDLTCVTAERCLASEFKGRPLTGDVSVEVSLISFADFVTYFGDDALAGLYAEQASPLSSCAEALCDAKDCPDEHDEDEGCDSTLCGRERVNTRSVCEDLGVRVIEVGAQGRTGPSVTQVLTDETDTDLCKEPARSFAAGDYSLDPGPYRAFARVGGRLPASELARIDIVAVDDDQGKADYCLLVPGMTVTLRAGQNIILVPFATIDEMVLAGVRPPECGA